MAFALDRDASVLEKLDLAYRADAAAPLARCAGVIAQFVPMDPKWQVRLDVLYRVVAGIGIERVYRVHAVLAVAPAIAAFVDLHVHPVGLTSEPAKGDHVQISDSGADLARHRLAKRLH